MNHFIILMPRLSGHSHRSGFKYFSAILILLLPLTILANEKCIVLNQIDIDDNELSTQSQRQQLQIPYISRCINPELLQQLLSSISDFYIQQGFITTRAYLREQDINDGQVDVSVLPGVIENIVDATSGEPSLWIVTAFGFRQSVLNIRELETALEVIERVPSVQADFKITAGSEPGASIIEINRDQSSKLHFEVGVSGETDVDPDYSAQVSIDNPLEINDILELRYNSGSLQAAYQTSQGKEVLYSFPIASLLFEISRSDISYRQRIQGISDSYLSSGDTESSRIKLSKLVFRDQRNRIKLALALDRKSTETRFEDVLVDVSSYKTTQAQFEISHDRFQPWGQISSSYSYVKGLDSYGARDDNYFTVENGFDNEARLQFEKHVIASRLNYYLDDPRYWYSFNIHLQYSDDILFTSDQLSLGNSYTVRGYAPALSGSSGWYMRHEISRSLAAGGNSVDGKKYQKSMSVSTGLDYAEAKCDSDNRTACGDIYALFASATIADRNFSLNLIWGHPLKKIDEETGRDDHYSLDLNWSF